MSSPRNPFDSKLTPQGGDGYFQIGMQLPRFYLRVLDEEGTYLAGMRRSQVLELLVLRKAGRLRVDRSPSAPRYRVASGEMDELVRFRGTAGPRSRISSTDFASVRATSCRAPGSFWR